MANSISKAFHQSTLSRYKSYKVMAEKALAQVSDEQFFADIHSGGNCLAVIVKHMAGNMISRWTDFMTTDGEKPDRHRDNEFIISSENSREELMAYWESAWAVCLTEIEKLSPEDLAATITIRREAHSVVDALLRQLAHYAYHIGQIVFVARWHAGEKWKTLSIARGQSDAFNAKMMGK
ncbi:MAG: DUF1572 family protein [Calditrichia bacterium]